MLIYSDSEDQAPGPSSRKTSRFFSNGWPLYSIIRDRQVGDILLWRNKMKTGSILAAFTVIWFLFEVVELHFITVACYSLMTLMLLLFIWTQAADFFRWRPPTIHDMQVSDSTARYMFSSVNKLLTKLFVISCGYNYARFFVNLALLWILSIVGSYSSALNVSYVVFLCMITVPVLYERYEREVHYIATQGKGDMRRLYKKLDSKVLSKIPRGPVKQKRYM